MADAERGEGGRDERGAVSRHGAMEAPRTSSISTDWPGCLTNTGGHFDLEDTVRSRPARSRGPAINRQFVNRLVNLASSSSTRRRRHGATRVPRLAPLVVGARLD